MVIGRSTFTCGRKDTLESIASSLRCLSTFRMANGAGPFFAPIKHLLFYIEPRRCSPVHSIAPAQRLSRAAFDFADIRRSRTARLGRLPLFWRRGASVRERHGCRNTCNGAVPFQAKKLNARGSELEPPDMPPSRPSVGPGALGLDAVPWAGPHGKGGRVPCAASPHGRSTRICRR